MSYQPWLMCAPIMTSTVVAFCFSGVEVTAEDIEKAVGAVVEPEKEADVCVQNYSTISAFHFSGVEVTAEDVEKAVGAVIEAGKEALLRDRYRFNGESNRAQPQGGTRTYSQSHGCMRLRAHDVIAVRKLWLQL